ncbi:hypothetical protein C345_03006, partial [Cryptococcus neoformans A2-102-5]
FCSSPSTPVHCYISQLSRAHNSLLLLLLFLPSLPSSS